MIITAEHSLLPSIPWGLTRATAPLPRAEASYDHVTLDPATQTTAFRDRAAGIVDMAKSKVTVTTSKGGGSDGSSGSSNVADDSNTDS
ncbi:putative ATP-grasp-modified RiPP [Streptosporangium sp. NPDC023615]|uniref:putative ATP-grasp-modified RiPP n=1 Tax=Streptosporangium sp. NPDC023615 TaxID=3154794 RepID=UPI00343FA308